MGGDCNSAVQSHPAHPRLRRRRGALQAQLDPPRLSLIQERTGAVIARLPQFVEDKLEVEARGRRGTTPYVAFVDGPVLALSALLVFFFARRVRSR